MLGNIYIERLEIATVAGRRVPPQTEAIDVEPSEAITSELIRTVYGNSSSGGNTASRAFSARVPSNHYETKLPCLATIAFLLHLCNVILFSNIEHLNRHLGKSNPKQNNNQNLNS